MKRNFDFRANIRLSIVLILLYSLAFGDGVSAQSNPDELGFLVKWTETPVLIDGELNDPIWQQTAGAVNFWQTFPSDTIQAGDQTRILMAYDDDHLYVVAQCYSLSDNYVVPTLKRDYSAGGSDNITLLFDTYNDGTNAFVFGLNPLGVMREALISNGGDSGGDWDDSWDTQWFGVSKIHEGYWLAEFRIPFKALRFKDGATKWRFNSYRFNVEGNERSSWTNIPRNQSIMSLAYLGNMKWEKPLNRTGSNITLIPFAASSNTWDFEKDPTDKSFKPSFGGDAKIALSSSLNLDLTFNPDFSQVEVDQQVTNLDRFEIFFPERRQFFLENADLFSSFGDSRINPFFSRRIGVATDTTGETVQNTIYYGARLSGKINNDWRVGLLNMQTAKDEEKGLAAANFTVAALQRKLFKRSNIGAIFVNKQTFDAEENEDLNAYNRVLGLDYNMASANSEWTGKLFFQKAFTPADEDHKWTHGLRLQRQRYRYRFRLVYDYVGEGYEAEVGFVPRKGFTRGKTEAELFFYPASGKVNRHTLGNVLQNIWTPEQGKTDHEYEAYWSVSFQNTAFFRLRFQHLYTYLIDSFDPTGVEQLELAAGTDYHYARVDMRFSTDSRKQFSFSLDPSYGEYYNGKRLNLSGQINTRFQPLGTLSINANYNRIELPGLDDPVNLYLVGTRLDLTFTKRIFLTTFLQYNTQVDNFNINARFQWRFKPVSDFFLVYTDNYNTDPNMVTGWQKKNRAIIAKVTYWLGL